MYKTDAAPVGLPGLSGGPTNAAAVVDNTLAQFQASLDSLVKSVKLEDADLPQRDQSITSAPIWLNTASNEYYVPNFGVFTADNDTMLVNSLGTISSGAASRGVNPPPGAEWVPISPATFAQRAEEIKNPGLLTLMSKNFGIGVDNMQMLAGYGLQVLGAEELGQSVVAQQEKDLQKTQVYNRQLEDINSVGTGFQWLAATIGQLGPSVVESMLAAAAGAVVGGGTAGAATGGVGAAPGAALGALTGFFAKSSVKALLKSAAEKVARNEALDAAETQIMKKALGASVAAKMTTDAQLLAATQALRTGVTRGAQAGVIGSNYLMGVGDIYGNQLEGGGEGNRLLALLGGIPYAAAESLADFHVAGRVLGDAIGTATPMAKLNWTGKAGELAKRGASGALPTAAVEGSTEAIQELIGIIADPTTDLNSGTGFSRLANAFAAGAAGGGVIGGLTNLGGNDPVNALQPTVNPTTGGTTNPLAPTPPAAPPAPTAQQLDLPLQMPPAVGEQITLPLNPQPYAEGVGIVAPSTPYETPAAPAALAPDATIAQRAAAPVAFSGQTNPAQPYQNLGLQQPLPAAPAVTPVAQRDELRRLTTAANELRAVIQNPQTDPVVAQRATAQLVQLDAAIQTLTPQVPPLQPTAPEAPSAADVATMQAQAPAPITPPAAPAPKGKRLTKAQRRAAEVAAQPELPVGTPVPAEQMALPLEVPAAPVAPKAAKLKKTKAAAPVVAPLTVPPAPAAPKAAKLKKTKAAAPAPAPAPAAPDTTTTASVPFMMTAKMRADLAARGFSAEAIKNMTPAEAQAELAKPAAPAPAAPKRTTITLKKGKSNAAQKGQDQQGGQQQRADAGRRLAEVGKNRNVAAKEQAGSDQAGSGNQPQQSGQKPKPLTVAARQQKQFVLPKATLGQTTIDNLRRAKVSEEQIKTMTPAQADEFLRLNKIGTQNRAAESKAAPVSLASTNARSVTGTVVEPFYTNAAASMGLQKALATLANADQRTSVRKDQAEFIITKALNNTAEDGKIANETIDALLEDKSSGDMLAILQAALEEYAADAKEKKAYGTLVKKVGAKTRPTQKPSGTIESDKAAVSGATDADMSVIDAMDDKNGKFMRTDGTPITQPMSIGRVKMSVAKFMSKLAIKPKVSAYRNVVDLKSQNPSLFNRAAAARANGDFAETEAMGYSFGDEIIIFSDFIQTEDQLNFVLAHETVGHFGLRAIMSRNQFTTIMGGLYSSDSRLRTVVDRMVELYGMDRYEAMEEYIADNAAMLDMSIWRKLSYALKNVLNRLGIRFHDDALRPLIAASRSYIRNGHTGTFVSARSVADRVRGMQDWASHGAFMAHAMNNTDLATKIVALRDINKIGGTLNQIVDAVQGNNYGRVMDLSGSSIKTFFGSFLRNLQTMNNKANKNQGLSDFMQVVRNQTDLLQTYRELFNEQLRYTTKINWFGSSEAPTDTDRSIANDMLAYGTLSRLKSVDDKAINAAGDLFEIVTYNEGTPSQYSEVVPRTIEEVQNGNKVQVRVIDKLFDEGLISADEFKNGLKYTDSLGNEQTKVIDVAESSKAYRIYKEARSAMREAFAMSVKSRYEALLQQQNQFTRRMKGFGFAEGDILTLKRIQDMYKKMYFEKSAFDNGTFVPDTKSGKLADQFLYEATRVLTEPKKLDDWLNSSATTDEKTKQFLGKEYQDIIGGLASLSKNQMAIAKLGKVQAALKNVTFMQADVTQAEYRAKRNLLEGYAPLSRRGRFQMRVEAVDANGQVVKLSHEFAGMMPYMRHNNEKALLDVAANLESALAGTWEVKNDMGEPVTVSFRPTVSVGQIVADVGDSADYKDFAALLNRFNLDMAPTKRKEIIKALSDATDSVRKGLERNGNIGWDENMVQSIAEFLNMSAAVSAKDTYRYQLEDIIATDSLWFGDYNRLQTLRQDWENETNPDAKAHKKGLYEEYAFRYIESHPISNGAEGNIELGGKTFRTKGQAKVYQTEASALLGYMASTNDLVDGTGLFSEHPVGSALKQMTVVNQLGMSIATAVANLTSLPTAAWGYLAFRNGKRNYGLGHGEGAAAVALGRAATHIWAHKFSNTDYLKSLTTDPALLAESGLTLDEAEFLLAQTRNGVLAVSLTDALMGTARGKKTASKTQAVIDGWMFTFTATERFNRRVTALAAYRLERDRNLAFMPDAEARLAAATTAETAVMTSQGDFNAANRPNWSRGNFTSLLFMYKLYTIMTFEMLRNLPTRGKLQVLAMMVLAAGLKGIPGEEDFMDIVTLIAQKLGFKIADANAELAKLFDAIIPGSSGVLMNGVLDLTGWTFSTRIGQGNVIPLTGALNYGADPWQEAKDFGGPVLGATLGMLNWGGLGLRKFTEVTGLNPDVTDWNQLLRESPVAMLRNLGDAVAYYDNGAVVNTRGQVVSKDMGTLTLIGRLLGFTPTSATVANETIRQGRALSAYSKDVTMKFMNAYVRAKLSGDNVGAAQIMRDVQSWNQNAFGTSFYIKDFSRKAERSLKEARRPAFARFRRTTPDTIRAEIDYLAAINGVDLNEE